MSTKDICNLNSLKAVKLIKVDFLQTSITEKPYKKYNNGDAYSRTSNIKNDSAKFRKAVLLWPRGSSVIVLLCFRGCFVYPKHLLVGNLWSSKFFLAGTLWDGKFFLVVILWAQHFFLWVFRRSIFFFFVGTLWAWEICSSVKNFFSWLVSKKSWDKIVSEAVLSIQKDFKS